ncbi:MAG: hypothetical protein WC544_04925 [Patescibacteria group bacterium]
MFADGDDVCSGGMHKVGQEYPVEIPDATSKPVGPEKPGQAPQLITCVQEGGNRCSVCHQMFADGDDICPQGHQIGVQYSR